MRNRRLVMYNDFVIIGPPATRPGSGACPGGRRPQAGRRAPVALRLPGGQVRHARARAGAVEAGGGRAAGPWYIESGQGMGADPRYRQRSTGVYHHRPRHAPRLPETPLAAHPRRKGPAAPEYLLGDGGQSGQRPARQRGGRQAFADFMVSPEVQAVIGPSAWTSTGSRCSCPSPGKKDEDSGGAPGRIVREGVLQALRPSSRRRRRGLAHHAALAPVSGAATVLSLLAGMPPARCRPRALPGARPRGQPGQYRHGAAAGGSASRDLPPLAERAPRRARSPHTPAAMVLAQLVIAAPVVTGLTLAAVQQIPDALPSPAPGPRRLPRAAHLGRC